MVLISLFNWTDVANKDEIGRECSEHGKERNEYWVLMENPEEKRQQGTIRLRWKDNTEIELRAITWRLWTQLVCFMVGTSGALL
jgi:hypothetical protein